MATEAQKKAVIKYDQKTYKRLVIRVRKDSDILEWLEKKESIQGYILELIKKDMEKKN